MKKQHWIIITISILFLIATLYGATAKTELQQDNSTTITAENQECAETCEIPITICSTNKIPQYNDESIKLDTSVENYSFFQKKQVDKLVFETPEELILYKEGYITDQEKTEATKPTLTKNTCTQYYLKITKQPKETIRWTGTFFGQIIDPFWIGTDLSIQITPIENTIPSINTNLTITSTGENNSAVYISNNITDWRISDTLISTQKSLALFNIPMKAYKSGNINTSNMTVKYYMDSDASTNVLTPDESGNGYNGVFYLNSTSGGWNATGGHDGGGAYEFVNNSGMTADKMGIGPGSFVINKAINEYTMNVWFKDNNKNTSTQYIRYILDAGSTYHALYVQNFGTGNVLNYKVVNSSINGIFTGYTGISPQTWYMATIVYNRTLIQLYLNGELVNSTTKNNDDLGATLGLALGNHQTVAGGLGGWNGTIDDFIYWNRSLTTGEIKNLYSNKGANITALDYSTNAYALKIQNTTWNQTGGHDGLGAYEFFTSTPTAGNGSGIIVNNGNTIVTTDNTNFSVSVWVKPATTAVNGCTGATCYIVSGTNTHYFLSQTSSSQYSLRILNETSSGYQIGSAGQVVPNKWTFLTTTYNGTNLELYIDGQLYNSTLIGNDGTPRLPLAQGFTIGKHPTLDKQNFNGSMDNMILWNRTLSAQQIWMLYNNQTNILSNTELENNKYYNACLTAYNNETESQTKCSPKVTTNQAPNITRIDLNSTSNLGLIGDNLTANYTITSTPNENLKNITTWLLNNQSVQLLNLPFEGGSNTTFTRDYTIFGNNGTVDNATWNITGGYDGFGTYNFNSGGLNNTQITASLNHSITNYTVTFWMNWQKQDSDVKGVLGRAVSTGINGSQFLFYINEANSKLILTVSNDTSIYNQNTINNIVINQNTWYFVAATFNDTSFAEWINGVQTGNATLPPSYTKFTNQPISIGGLGQLSGTTHFFKGMVDDLVIWDRALSAEQIYALNFSQNNVLVGNENKVGDIWQVCGTTNNGYQDSNTICSNNITIIASIPTITPTITANGGNNFTNENINLTFTYLNPDNLPITTNYTKWFINNIERTSLENMTNIHMNETNESDLWQINMSVFDGQQWSNWTTSNTIYIQKENVTIYANNTPQQQPISNFSIQLQGTTWNTTTGSIYTNISRLDQNNTWQYNATSPTYYTQNGSINGTQSNQTYTYLHNARIQIFATGKQYLNTINNFSIITNYGQYNTTTGIIQLNWTINNYSITFTSPLGYWNMTGTLNVNAPTQNLTITGAYNNHLIFISTDNTTQINNAIFTFDGTQYITKQYYINTIPTSANNLLNIQVEASDYDTKFFNMTNSSQPITQYVTMKPNGITDGVIILAFLYLIIIIFYTISRNNTTKMIISAGLLFILGGLGALIIQNTISMTLAGITTIISCLMIIDIITRKFK